MNIAAILLNLVVNYKTYVSVILAIGSGVGMIVSKNYSDGLHQIFQALLILFGGASVASLKSDVSKTQAKLTSLVEAQVKAGAKARAKA